MVLLRLETFRGAIKIWKKLTHMKRALPLQSTVSCKKIRKTFLVTSYQFDQVRERQRGHCSPRVFKGMGANLGKITAYLVNQIQVTLSSGLSVVNTISEVLIAASKLSLKPIDVLQSSSIMIFLGNGVAVVTYQGLSLLS